MPEIKALNGTVRVDRNEEGEVFLHVQEDNKDKDEAVLFGSQVRMTPNQAIDVYIAIQVQGEAVVEGRMKRQKLLDLATRPRSV